MTLRFFILIFVLCASAHAGELFCTTFFEGLSGSPYLIESEQGHQLDPEALARKFEEMFGEPPEAIYLVGSFVHGYEPPSPGSDVDLVFVVPPGVFKSHPQLAKSGKFQGVGFEFLRAINPGRVDPRFTGIGMGPTETAIYNGEFNGRRGIPKSGLLDPFFGAVAPTEGAPRRIWGAAPLSNQ